MLNFVFWGVFLAFFLIVWGYWVWMIRTERAEEARERREGGNEGGGP